MYYNELSETIDHILHDGKGILAADESIGTIAKRFAAIGIENTENNRRDYRLLLATAPDLSRYISGMILFEETFTQHHESGVSIPDYLAQAGILPGIKIDKGLIDLPNTEHEKVTQGLDGLTDRLVHFKSLGARFAKWRNVYSISEFAPSIAAIKTGAETLARYASTCQAIGLVPIVEPEVLMDGDHSIEEAAEVSEIVLHELFNALFIHQVELEHIILKPSMVTCGKEVSPFSSAQDIADFTLSVFRNHVPAAVPSINFLSGGQTPDQATHHLNAINNNGIQPWALSFSFGRALQDDCLQTWKGQPGNVQQAQAVLLERARQNSLAYFGEFESDSIG